MKITGRADSFRRDHGPARWLTVLAMLSVVGSANLGLAQTPATKRATARSSAAPLAGSATESVTVLKARARAAGRALVLDFSTTWCGPCQMFERNVLSLPSVQQALGQVLFARYDGDHEPGRGAARELRVIGYPTFLAFAQDGRQIDRVEGYQSPRQFTEWLGRVAAQSESTETLLARLAQQPGDVTTLLTLARRSDKEGDATQAVAYLTRAQAALSPPGAPPPDEKRAALVATVDWELRMTRLRKLMRDEPRKALVEHLLQHPRGPTAEQALKSLGRLGPADAQARQAFLHYLDAHREPGQAEELNQAVYHFLRAQALDEAEQAARHLLSLDGNSPLFLDTLAEVQHLRGRRDEAVRLSDRALATLGAKTDTETEQVRTAVQRNRARFARGLRELPDQLRGESDELEPWE